MVSERFPEFISPRAAEGQAALYLAESLILALIEARVVNKEQIVEAIELVISTKQTLEIEGERPELARAAVGIVTKIANSISAAPE